MNQDELRKAAVAYIEAENHPVFKGDVQKILDKQDWTELNERFAVSLSFGTGGLRGLIGGGTNRINPMVICSATQGLANYVKASVFGEKSAVIAYDSRQYSDLFALEAALVLCANGIRTSLFKELRPTPELSFAVRRLKATIGIVVTASHNPPEYNGYKVYWSDGAQVVPPHDEGIIAEVRKTQGTFGRISKEEALQKNLLVMIDQEIDIPYQEMVKAQCLRPELYKQQITAPLKIVYTPLHGTGITLLPQIMQELGIRLIHVPEQARPDSQFSTVTSPNPEESSAMSMAIALAKEEKALLVLGTDPDADRVGVGVPYGQDWILLNGNQLGALLADYIFSTLKQQGRMPNKPAFVNTIVTTDLHHKIAEKYGVASYKVLTGFKHIAQKMREFDQEEDGPQYVFGCEESYGFLFGSQVRDKDAISTSALVIEMALYHLSEGRTIMDALHRLFDEWGFYQEVQISKTFKGLTGLEKMKTFMDHLRHRPSWTIGSFKVEKILDIKTGQTITSNGERIKNISLPSSDVLQFILLDGSIVTVRPSGTEPKIKFYASCCAPSGLPLEEAQKQVEDKIKEINRVLDHWITL